MLKHFSKKINRRTPKKASKHFNKEIFKKLEKKKDTIRHQKLIKIRRQTDLLKDWPINRKYSNYSQHFNYGFKRHGLGNNFVDFLKKRAKINKGPVSVFELGYGEGHFLAELKQKLNSEKIPNKVEGISLVDNSLKENQKYIDKKTNISATEHLVNKKYDLIVDFNGAIYYSFSDVVDYRKEMILKYAYALKKGGALVLNVDFFKTSKKLDSILSHLKKQGFLANFYELDSEPNNSNYYKTLIIERN